MTIMINKENEVTVLRMRRGLHRSTNISMHQLQHLFSSPCYSFGEWLSMMLPKSRTFTNFIFSVIVGSPCTIFFWCISLRRLWKFKWPNLLCHDHDSSSTPTFKAISFVYLKVSGKLLFGAIITSVTINFSFPSSSLYSYDIQSEEHSHAPELSNANQVLI